MNLKDFTSDDRQIIIERITPEIDCGRYPIKRVIGDTVEVQADIFRDGHDLIAAAIRYRFLPANADSGSPDSTLNDWQEAPMVKFDNDRWKGEFKLAEIGRCVYQIEAWNDRFGTWEHDMEKRVAASQVEQSDVLEGVALVKAAIYRMPPQGRRLAEQERVQASLAGIVAALARCAFLLS